MTATVRPERHQVEERILRGPDAADIPGWKWDAAQWGVQWVTRRVFPSMRAQGRVPDIKWFRPASGWTIGGMAASALPHLPILLNVELASWELVIEVAAHETVHAAGIHDEHAPTLIGKLAAAHWAGRRTVSVHHGRLPSHWIPEEAKDGRVAANAVLLAFDDGFTTYVNRGTDRAPRWVAAHVEV